MTVDARRQFEYYVNIRIAPCPRRPAAFFTEVTMSLLKCPKCGEMFSDSYKTCPFCAEDDAYFDGGVKPRKKKGPGRRVEGHDRGPSILGPALIVVVLLLAAVLIYSFFGEKISKMIHRNDPEPVDRAFSLR